MQQLQIIGNLAADATIQSFNGQQFVSFRVGCSEKRTANGQEQKFTTWYSVTYNNAGSGVVPYLKKGQKVFVSGFPTFALYDSATYRCKMIDVRLSAHTIELCGSAQQSGDKPDENQPTTSNQPATAPQEEEAAKDDMPF